MLYPEFAKYVRWLTSTNSTTFSDDEIVLVANTIVEEFAQEIAKVNEDYFGLVFNRDLVAGQREYGFPTEICNNMKRLEISIEGELDDLGNLKYRVADEFDLNLFQHSTDEDTILKEFNDKAPAFEIFGGSIYIYSGKSVIDVVDGLKLWAIIYPQKITIADLTDNVEMDVPKTSTSFGLKRQFHRLLAVRTSIQWKQAREKPIPLRGDEITFDASFQSAIESVRGMNLDKAVVAQVPYNDGTQY